MANPFQQKARQRKVIYLVLIVALFTGSLLHRRLSVERQAENLMLREVSRGEVELTSSAVRLSLTGSRGVAVTLLWWAAIEKSKKHEWNEFELLARSVTKLQPHFITPWLFQSWNLAFNVSVECDRPFDKYYYVSRGLAMLAEGERRNQGTVADDAGTGADGRPRFPGHPELRHHMGFTYQLKIGNSDEKTTMRSLLDLSCIDPLRRDPDKFWRPDPASGRPVLNEKAFADFARDNPRLVRRLSEHLFKRNKTPEEVVRFLERNRDVPTRFSKTAVPGQKESTLEPVLQQFPILPATRARPGWPDPAQYKLSDESLDVFLIARTWYQYAQEPLPPELLDPGVSEKEREWNEKVVDRQKHRLPKAMAIQIFRSYPSRAQAYIAENLEAEGWFDSEGWLVKDSFEGYTFPSELENLLVGTEAKYHAGQSWDTTYRMYEDYGRRNGLLLSPETVARLNAQARAFRDEFKIRDEETGPPFLRTDQQARLGASFEAHQKLFWNMHYRTMTNFDAHLDEAEGERWGDTVQARKAMYRAVRLRRSGNFQAPEAFEEAFALWINALVQHPRLARISTIQEDLYEPEWNYLLDAQKQPRNAEVFRAVAMGGAQMAAWPYSPWHELLDAPEKRKMFPTRKVNGPLDVVILYDGPDAEALRQACFAVTHGAAAATGTGGAPPVPLPGQENFALVGSTIRTAAPPPEGWRYLLTDQNLQAAKQR